jgi:myo-inositol-1(or 4)-monophosphatase
MLNIAIQAARSAGKIIVRFLDHLDANDITEKERHDFVTKVDRMAEEEIINTIQRSYPSHNILAEESGLRSGTTNCTWIIDPLDGTINFIHGFPHFCVSIAFQRNDKLEVGVIYDPLRQELFTAVRGMGAQLNNRKIRVSPCKKLDNALLGTGFPSRIEKHIQFYLKTLGVILPQTVGVRRAGSAALDIAYVAAGRLDGFWEMGLKSWDIAAGAVILMEAGGIISDFQGGMGYFKSGEVVAATPKLHKPLVDIIQSATRE